VHEVDPGPDLLEAPADELGVVRVVLDEEDPQLRHHPLGSRRHATFLPDARAAVKREASKNEALRPRRRRVDDAPVPAPGRCPMPRTRGFAPAAVACLPLLLAAGAEAASWRVPGHFPTIQAAIDSPQVRDGDTLRVRAGRHAGATVTKALEIRAEGHAVVRSGPVLNALGEAGFLFPGEGKGSGASILGFVFEDVAFPVFSRGADDVTVARNVLHRPVQGVSNWGGSGWEIAHNLVLGLRTACGGGIGMFAGDSRGGAVSGNRIAHNDVRGAVFVPADDCGGYSASAVSLFADFRYGSAGASAVEHNRIAKNRVRLDSTRPELVPASGVALAELTVPDGQAPPERVIRTNAVVFNDLRGVDTPVALTPEDLADENRISRNLTRAPGGRRPLGEDAEADAFPGAANAPAGRGPGPKPIR
jgi:hypothetical protein